MTKQQLPSWVEVETAKTRKQPTPKDMPKKKPTEPEIPIAVLVAIEQAEAAGQYRRAEELRRPYIKLAEPEPEISYRVTVTLMGTIDFTLKGQDAKDFNELLREGVEAAEVIEHLDPWSSGAEIKQTIEIAEVPARWGGLHVQVDEESGLIYTLGGAWS